MYFWFACFTNYLVFFCLHLLTEIRMIVISVKFFDSSVNKKSFWKKYFILRKRFKCVSSTLRTVIYLLEKTYLIKSLVRHLQFMVGRKHNLVGHLILPQFFPIRQNVRCVFRLVGQFLILVIVQCRTVVLGPRYRKGRVTWNGLKEAIFFMVQVILTAILRATLIYIYVVCTLCIRIYYTDLFFLLREK